MEANLNITYLPCCRNMELLDPVAESQRLQREGYVTPVDPNATAEVEEEAPAPEDLTYSIGRPPRLNTYGWKEPAF